MTTRKTLRVRIARAVADRLVVVVFSRVGVRVLAVLAVLFLCAMVAASFTAFVWLVTQVTHSHADYGEGFLRAFVWCILVAIGVFVLCRWLVCSSRPRSGRIQIDTVSSPKDKLPMMDYPVDEWLVSFERAREQASRNEKGDEQRPRDPNGEGQEHE